MRTRARKKVLDLLADMDRTEAELRTKLRRKEFPQELIDDAIEYARSYGYINDARYAKRYFEVMADRRSRKRMEYDLIQKGVDPELIRQAALESEGADERPLVRREAEKKLRSLDISDPKSRDKLAAYLARKGFRAGDIFSVIGEYFPRD